MGFFDQIGTYMEIQNAKYEKDECGAALVKDGMRAQPMDPSHLTKNNNPAETTSMADMHPCIHRLKK